MEFLKKIDRKVFNIKRKLASSKKRLYSKSDFSKLKSINNQNFAHNKILRDVIYDSSSPRERISKCLKENGIVVIQDLIPRDLALQAGEEVEKLILYLDGKLQEMDYYEEEGICAQHGRSRLNGYKEYVEFGKPLLIKRRANKESIDGGMLDFFHVDRIMEEEKYQGLKRCNSILKRFDIRDLISSQSKKIITQKQSNIYYNKNVKNPRGLHIDSVYETYKSFLYFTDVKSEGDGPYRFVPESHKKNKAKKYSILQNSKISNFYSEEDILLSPKLSIPFISEAGTLAITYQNGIHGGTPQKEGSKRIILVSNYG